MLFVICLPHSIGVMLVALTIIAAASSYNYYYYYGQGTGPILMDDVACTGSESGLINCTYDNNTGDCSHYYDAGVRCYSPPSSGECQLTTSIELYVHNWACSTVIK